MALLGRIIVICFALMLASLAAGLAIALAIVGPFWHGAVGGGSADVPADIIERVFFWGTVFFASTATGAVTLLPAAILIAVAEALKIRSVIAYAVAGAVVLLACYYTNAGTTRYEESIDHPPPPISRAAELSVAGGAVFGFVFWLIAGRNAGRWRERRRAAGPGQVASDDAAR
jgi:hypothetical protein